MDLPLFIHISGGAFGLLTGTLALSSRKGADSHKQAGYIFVIAMLAMALSGGILSHHAEKPFDILSSWLTCYMVLTGWMAFKPSYGRGVVILMFVGASCLVGYLSVEVYALATGIRATDAPTGAGYIFASILGLALFGDYKLLSRPHLKKQRIIRHVWRMNFGLLVATVSFFGARPHLFPDWMQASGILLLLAFAPVLVMAYWRFRLRPQTPLGGH